MNIGRTGDIVAPEANSTSIKNLIGHSSFLTTEKIYSHKYVEELRKAIKLIE